jgi:aminoglycoside/choline kinase family phosphotransferase
MRPGLPQYDLASLLYDPYVRLPEGERTALLDHYLEGLADFGQAPAADFAAIYDLCAMQRLMQALGAYGFLGHVKERPHFLEHIPAALSSLREVLARIPGLNGLRAQLAALSV